MYSGPTSTEPSARSSWMSATLLAMSPEEFEDFLWSLHLEPDEEKTISDILSRVPELPELARRANKDGETALIVTSSVASPSVVKLLCDLGADVNAWSALGETPLINVVRG